MDFTADRQSGHETIPQLKILVVDDDILNQRMMQLLLAREGHLVELASNGVEAFDAVKNNWYDVVFMDLQMPVMDGIEASRQIRNWENGGQHTFIVALTASYLPEQGHVLFEAGIDNYISKPFEMEQVQRLLKYGFQSRLASNPPILIDEPLVREKALDIQKGIAQVGGDEAMYKELLGDFIQGLPNRVQMIYDLGKKKDLVELSRAAHNLQGIAASLGATRLALWARKLDQQSVEGPLDTLESLISEIQRNVGELLEISNNFLAEKQMRVSSV